MAIAVTALVCSLAIATPAWSQNRPAPHSQSQPRAQNQGHSGEWLRQHRSLPPEQQRKALESDPRFRSLPPQRQQQLRNQLQRFNNMPAQQQERTLRRMETWEHLTPAQKQQARQLHDQMQQLPPERRQAIRNAVQSLRAMPPDARQRTIDSDAYKNHFSPQEREMLGNASRLPLAPAEPNDATP
jgi:phage-related protein